MRIGSRAKGIGMRQGFRGHAERCLSDGGWT